MSRDSSQNFVFGTNEWVQEGGFNQVDYQDDGTVSVSVSFHRTTGVGAIERVGLHAYLDGQFRLDLGVSNLLSAARLHRALDILGVARPAVDTQIPTEFSITFDSRATHSFYEIVRGLLMQQRLYS